MLNCSILNHTILSLPILSRTILSKMARSGSACGGGQPPKVAVILAGSGFLDGSEIHEAVAVLSHLQRNGAQVQCFAPDIPQTEVIDHNKGKPDCGGQRNVLSESARIARTTVCPLSALMAKAQEFQAVIVPGGFGVAKNLSDFATKGDQMEVNKEVCEAITMFHKCKKPIGLVCIAPILAAKLIPCVTITLGKACPPDKWPHKDAIEAAKKMGAKTEDKEVNEFSFDDKNKVYSTPAYMYDGQYNEIDDGVGIMVCELVKSLK